MILSDKCLKTMQKGENMLLYRHPKGGNYNMENKNFRSLDEILQSINQEQITVETMQGDLRSKSKGRIRRFFSPNDYEKQQFKLYRTETKGKIKSGKTSIKSKKNYLDNLCTFDFDVATQFLAGALSVIEGEQYESTEIELSHTTLMAAGKVMIPISHDDSVCLISTSENTRQISKLYDDDEISDSDDIEDSIQDGKYILLELDDEYCLFDYDTQQVSEELTETYPYLSTVVCDLISLRLANSNLSDKQSSDLMLQQMPKRYSDLIGNSRGRKR
jgi:hypothetical protein